MANRERGEFRLVTSTHTYILRLTVEACGELEDRSGKDFDAISAGVNRGRVTDLRWLLWAALQDVHGVIFPSPDDVGAVVDATPDLRKQLAAFMKLNAPPEPEKGKAAASRWRGQNRRTNVWARLYVDARVMGMDVDTFWGLSLRELWREMAVSRVKLKQQRDSQITLAWYVCALVWQKKLPELSSLLNAPASRQQSPADLSTMLHVISEQYGLPLRVVKKAS